MTEQQPVVPSQPHHEELLTLAALAGVKAPTNVMAIMIELLGINVPPTEIYLLVRDILVSKNRTRRSAKLSSQRSSRQGESGAPLPTSVPAKPSVPQ